MSIASFLKNSPDAMGQSNAEVITLLNKQVNMTADELEAWLDDPQSRKAGTGVGIECGRDIVETLCKNPGKNPDGYDEVRSDSERGDSSVWLNTKIAEQEDIAYIRKVPAVRYVLCHEEREVVLYPARKKIQPWSCQLQ
jgi:Protein of unknown function (DUF3140)